MFMTLKSTSAAIRRAARWWFSRSRIEADIYSVRGRGYDRFAMSVPTAWRDEAPLNLVFDADDTLWDSNSHFLDAFEAFVEAIAALGVDTHRDSVKAAVREAELELIQTHGYGRRPYVIALDR